ncbi:hypothetical protein LCGC14_2324010 [marine sediment metagenome]|uniref:Uncharacterized protein n=1 Tax=marine sediment metagenome TaxID=412755 RepID=A0A0F9EUD5_9ZZZZ
MRITRVKKARKDQGSCGRCFEPLLKGYSYRWIKFRRGGKRKRCMKNACRFRASDMTTSDKRSDFFSAQEQIEDEVTALQNSLSEFIPERISECLEGIVSQIEESAMSIEEVAEGYDESAANMEEYFSGSSQIDEIVEKAEQCRSRAQEWEDLQGKASEMAENVKECDFTFERIESLLEEIADLAIDDPMW